jgi:hypothetical protein
MKITRRRLLTGLGSALATVPFLRALPSSAGEGEFPRRLVFFYSPNDSMDRWCWEPNDGVDGSPIAGPLPTMLSALDEFADQLVIIGNMHMKTREKEMGPGGHVGMGHQLTGVVNSLWPNQQQESEFWGGGISIDQHIANELGTPALTLAAVPYGNSGGCRISYRGRDEPVHPHEDPVAAFASIFGDIDQTPNEQLAHNQRQVKSMDRVALELERLRPRLPSEDRTKMDKHLEHLLALQEGLEAFVPADCSPTAPEESFDYNSSQDFPITARRHMDILAQALACGVTQVASIQNGNTGNAENYSGGNSWPSEGIEYPVSQHVIAHDFELEPDDPVFYERRLAIEQFYVRQYAYLLARLRDIPEGSGSVLDNTMVVWTKGMGRGHSMDRLLYMIAGGKNIPGVGSSRYLDRDGIPHNNFLVTLANLMGVELDTFGDPEICTGALSL